VMRARFDRLQRWHREAPDWGEDWVAANVETTARLQLTRDELADLTRELVAVVDRYRGLQSGRSPRDTSDGAVPVTVQVDAFPSGDPPAPGA
jgi:hypothetical protein